MEYIGDRIGKFRKEKNFTREKLAELTGISSVTLWRYEKAKDVKSLQAENLQKIAAALGCTVSDLLGEGNSEQTSFPRQLDGVRVVESVQLPVLSPEMTACCGAGIPALDVTSEPTEYVMFAKADIGSCFDDLRPPFAIHADGDSMKGYNIPNGCIVAVNPAETVASMDIALVSYFGKLALKKLRFLPDGSVDLLSSDGEKIHIPPDENIPELFYVIGKAMAQSCKIPHGI